MNPSSSTGKTAFPFVLQIFLLLLVPVSLHSADSGSGPGTTVILVRHAERDKGQDPPLNRLGKARALDLKQALLNAGITAIYVPDLLRNRQTAAPLAEALGIEPVLFSKDRLNDTPQLAADFADSVRTRHTGGVVLWIGNQKPEVRGMQGNLQEIYRELGGQGMPVTRYFDMYVFRIHESDEPRYMHVFYGAISDQ